MSKRTIKDNYSHLKFKKATNSAQLKVGMMVQIVEGNRHPWRWEWIELDVGKLSLIVSKWEKSSKWIRLMDE